MSLQTEVLSEPGSSVIENRLDPKLNQMEPQDIHTYQVM